MNTEPFNDKVLKKLKYLFSNLQIAADFFRINNLPPETIKTWLSGSHAFTFEEVKMIEDYFAISLMEPHVIIAPALKVDDGVANAFVAHLSARYRLRDKIGESLVSQLEKKSPPLFKTILDIIEHSQSLSRSRRSWIIQWLSEDDPTPKLANRASLTSAVTPHAAHSHLSHIMIIKQVVSDIAGFAPFEIAYKEIFEKTILRVDDELTKRIRHHDMEQFSKRGLSTIINAAKGDRYDTWKLGSGNFYIIPAAYKDHINIESFYNSIHEIVNHGMPDGGSIKILDEVEKKYLTSNPLHIAEINVFIEEMIASEFNLHIHDEIHFTPTSIDSEALDDLVYKAVEKIGKPVNINSVFHYFNENHPDLQVHRPAIHEVLKNHPLLSGYLYHGKKWYAIREFEAEWKMQQGCHLIDRIHKYITDQGKPVHISEIEEYLMEPYQLDQQQIRVIIKSDPKRQVIFIGKGFYDIGDGHPIKTNRRHQFTITKGVFFRI